MVTIKGVVILYLPKQLQKKSKFLRIRFLANSQIFIKFATFVKIKKVLVILSSSRLVPLRPPSWRRRNRWKNIWRGGGTSGEMEVHLEKWWNNWRGGVTSGEVEEDLEEHLERWRNIWRGGWTSGRTSGEVKVWRIQGRFMCECSEGDADDRVRWKQVTLKGTAKGKKRRW